jgi:hypothetical protein
VEEVEEEEEEEEEIGVCLEFIAWILRSYS